MGTIGGNPLISPPFGFTDTGTLNVDNIELIQTGNTVPTPIQEKLIWQANFDSTFPNDGRVTAFIIAMALTMPAELWPRM